MPRFTWGTGGIDGWFVPVLDHAGVGHFSLLVSTKGKLGIQFKSLPPPFDDIKLRGEFLRRLNEIPRVSIPQDGIGRWPRVPLAVFAANPEALESLKGVLDWFCETVRSGEGDHPYR